MKAIEPNARQITWRMPAVKLSEQQALRPLVHAFCRLRAKNARYTAVNALARGEKGLTMRFLAHRENKSDGFLLLDQGEKGLHVYLIDGGLATGESLDALLRLREKILAENGLAAHMSSPRYKLEVTLLISHFHIDHINEVIHQVLPCPFIRVRAAYYPCTSAFAQDQNHNFMRNGDLCHRPNLLRVAACYQPLMEKHEMRFAQTRTLPLQNGEIQLFMPPRDWGEPRAVEYIKTQYLQNEPQKVFDNLSVSVVNANSLWMRILLGAHAVLLTGDVTKKLPEGGEALEEMIAFYGEALRSDIVKMPHHGIGRNNAVPLVVKDLLRRGESECVVLTALKGDAQAGEVLRDMQVPYACNSTGEIAFTITESGLSRVIKEENA